MITIELIEKFVKIGAIFIAGAWVYFKTIRGRTFIPRLQPQVSGNWITQDGHQYLLVKAQVENVGSSIAYVKEEGTAYSAQINPARIAQMNPAIKQQQGWRRKHFFLSK